MTTRACRARWRAAVAGGLLALAVGLAQAAEVWLQTSTVGHAAPVMRIAADAARDAVVTVSDDKTARIWALSDGRLVAVLRPRVGPARDGRQFGVALHPQDDVVATGGSQQRADGREPMLWLHELSTGRLLRTIPAVGEHVRRLRWSTDGRLLLACYAEPGALRAFDAATGALVLEQPMDGDCLAMAVRGDRVAAASRGVDKRPGEVRVYRQNGARLEPVTAFGARGDALSLDFSPDGRQLAVGYFTPGEGAAVLDAATGALQATLRTPRDVRDPSETDWITRTQAVAWSADGTTVYTGNSTEQGSGPVEGRIETFDAASGAPRRSTVVAPDTVVDLTVLPDPGGGERIVWASYVGTWGAIDGLGRERLRAQPEQREIDFAVRRGAGELWVSADARRVRWARGLERRPVSFDLPRRATGAGATGGLHAPRTRGGWFDRASDFENHFFPKVRGRTIALRTGEFSRALAYVGTEGDVVLATTERLQRLDGQLRTVWEIRTATDVRAVNTSADGRLVVAQLNDGTLRWFRAADGALLLSALVMADGWLLWMSSGHFEASHGVESRLGWLVDMPGAPAPDFFALGRFRDQYHRPDIIDRVLDELDVSRAVQLADAAIASQVAARPPSALPAPVVASAPTRPALPAPPAAPTRLPEVPAPSAPVPPPAAATVSVPPAPAPTAGAPPPVDRLLVPARLDLPPVLQPLVPLRLGRVGSPQVTLRFSMRADQPRDALRLEARVDGRRVTPSQVRWPEQFDGRAVGEATVAVRGGVQVVQLIARAARLASEPVSFQIDAGDARPLEPEAGQGVLHVLAVGVGRYADTRVPSLRLPAKDARDFAAWARTQAGGLYREVQVRLLTETEVTRQSVEEGLAWLLGQVGPDDAGVVFLAGHGQNQEGGAGYRFLPHDYSQDLPSRTTVPAGMLVDTLGALRGRAMLFLDSCHAGGAANLIGVRADDTARLTNALAAPENAVLVFASSGVRQLSYESDDWLNGAFTRSLLEGLRGAARLQDLPLVTARSLTPFVRQRVEALTTDDKGAVLQSPVVVIPPHTPERILASLLPLR